jgi:hypothetical protein
MGRPADDARKLIAASFDALGWSGFSGGRSTAAIFFLLRALEGVRMRSTNRSVLACVVMVVAATVGCSQSPDEAVVGTYGGSTTGIGGMAKAIKLKNENPDISGSEALAAATAMSLMALDLRSDKTATFFAGATTMTGTWKLDPATREITLTFDKGTVLSAPDAGGEFASQTWTAVASKDYSAVKVYMAPPETVREAKTLVPDGQDFGIIMKKK